MAEFSANALAGPESRFGWALLVALLIEIAAIGTFMIVPSHPLPREVRPATMAIHMIKPIGPPKMLPLPPKPVQPPKPPPPLPVPVLPKPPPPLPHHPHITVPRRPPPPHPVQHPVSRPVSRPTPPQPAPIQAPPAPHVSAPPPSAAQIQSAEARYVGIIRGVILGHLVVPQSLRNLGASGLAMVAFKVAPDGRILWVRVVKRSGYAAANRAARAAVQGSSFPAFLKTMPPHAIMFEIPIHVSGDD